ncbi:MAG: hypothetical protein LUC60_01970, partial [Lachnospiraceae bacterium]|nr:hypothetical protein [Lachnospiraceae bacterium]
LPNAMLTAAGYVANEQQSAESLAMIRNLTGLLPFVVAIVTIIIFGAFYKLNEEGLAQMQKEIAERDGVQ